MSKFHLAALACLLTGAVLFGASCKPSGGSPTEAYKALYTAVHKKDTQGIKRLLSKSTIEFITGTSAMQKKPFDEAIANGLTESAMGATMPEICNERIEGQYAAVEVKPANGKWEDLPFVLEDGSWKLAVGDIFQGTYKVTSKPKCIPAPTMPIPTNPGGPMPQPSNAPQPGPPGTGGAPGPGAPQPAPNQMPPAPMPGNPKTAPMDTPAPIKPPTKSGGNPVPAPTKVP
jgi:hypothetical protein